MNLPEHYEVVMGSDVQRGGMFLELWTLPRLSSELAMWAFYSDVDGSMEFQSYRLDVPPDVASWFEQEARKRLPLSSSREAD